MAQSILDRYRARHFPTQVRGGRGQGHGSSCITVGSTAQRIARHGLANGRVAHEGVCKHALAHHEGVGGFRLEAGACKSHAEENGLTTAGFARRRAKDSMRPGERKETHGVDWQEAVRCGRQVQALRNVGRRAAGYALETNDSRKLVGKSPHGELGVEWTRARQARFKMSLHR
eukprot:3069785-Pleurochrysis_carterae.AAC.1